MTPPLMALSIKKKMSSRAPDVVNSYINILFCIEEKNNSFYFFPPFLKNGDLAPEIISCFMSDPVQMR